MLRSMIAAALAFAFVVATVDTAAARRASAPVLSCDNDGRCVVDNGAPPTTSRQAGPRSSAGDPRPARWCMWWLRRELGIPKSAFRPFEYNLARAGRYIGAPASGPAVGAIVVWRHHVGIITGRTATGWVVKSGNDGKAVRERERSLQGAIAFRWPHQSFASGS